MKENRKQIFAAALAVAALLGGMSAQAAAPRTVELGDGAEAAVKNSVAIGAGALAADIVDIGEEEYGQSTAVGYYAQALDDGAVALGASSNANGNQSTAVGYAAEAATSAAAFGGHSYAGEFRSTAVGLMARAVAKNSVAFGAYSVASEEGVISVGHKKGENNGHPGETYKEDLQRRIVNVADGIFAADSHDAVTAGQLYAAGIVPGTIEAKPGDTAKNSIALGEKSKVTGNNSIAIGGQALSSANVVIGQSAKASAASATAIGMNSQALAKDATALGNNAWAQAKGSVALGNGSVANESNVVSVGNSTLQRRIVNVAAGVEDSDAATVEQAKGFAAYEATKAVKGVLKFDQKNGSYTDNVTIGGTMTAQKYAFKDENGNFIADLSGKDILTAMKAGQNAGLIGVDADGQAYVATKSSQNGVALGNKANAATNGSVAIGFNAQAGIGPRNKATAIGYEAKALHESSVALGDKSYVGQNEGNVVSVGKSGKDGFQRKVINVAAGVNEYDAVNKGQLDELDQKAVKYDDNGNVTIATPSKNATLVVSEGATGFTNGTASVSLYGGQASVLAGGNGFTVNDKGTTLVGGLNVSNSKITGVAAGTEATDAVNKGQLDEVSKSVTELDALAVKYTNSSKKEVNLGNAKLTWVSDISMRINNRGYSFTDAGLLPGNADGHKQSTVIGAASKVSGDYATAIGNNSAAAKNGLAVGTYASAEENSVVLGSGDSSLAAPKAGKKNSVAIGTYVDSNSENSTAIGYGAQIGWEGKNSIALGADSVANEENVFSIGHKKGDSNGFGGTYAEDLNRRITNVAAGEKATDAVNKAQLDAVKDLAGKHTVVKAGDENVVVKETDDNGQKVYDVALADSINVKNASFNSLAVNGPTALNGVTTIKSGKSSVIVDNNFIQAQVGNTSVQVNANGVAVTGNTNVNGTLTVNNEEVATKDDVASVSGEVDKLNDKVTGLESTVTNQGAQIESNKNAIKANQDAIAANKEAIGKNANDIASNKAQIDQNTRDIATNSAKIAEHTQKIAEHDQQIKEHTATLADHDRRIEKNTNDIKAQGDRLTTAENTIKDNVSRIDGLEKSSSATNGRIDKAEEKIAENAGKIAANADAIKVETANREAAIKDEAAKREAADKEIKAHIGVDSQGNYAVIDNGAETLTDGINRNTHAITSLGHRVNTLSDEVDSVGAISAALAGLHPLDYDTTQSKYQLSAALGSYDGSQALALGGFYNVNKDVLLSLGVSTALKGERKTAGNLGVTFRVGAGAKEEAAAPETDKDILTRLAELDQKISVLEQKNEALEKENADQKKQIEVLQAKTF